MLFKEWIDNPSTKKIPGYNLVRDQLKGRYKAMVKSGKKFVINVYQYPGNGLIAHVKVPTEGEVPDLSYDILLHVTGSGSIIDSDIKVFSNCPSFTYRYAYVCNELELLIPEYVKYYDKEVLTKEPVETNPTQIMGYEKSILYALWALEDHGYKTYTDLNGDVLMDRSQLKSIMTAEAKKQQAQILKRKFSEHNKKVKAKKTVDLASGTTISRSSAIETSRGKISGGGKITGKKPKSKITGKKKR